MTTGRSVVSGPPSLLEITLLPRALGRAIDALIEHVTPFPTRDTVAFFDWMGGAIGRADSDASAFPDRDKACALTVAPKWTAPAEDEKCIEWARSFHDAIAPYAAEGAYVNYLNEDDADRIETAYHDRYDRLVTIKNEWDPDNLFRMNQNIEPTV